MNTIAAHLSQLSRAELTSRLQQQRAAAPEDLHLSNTATALEGFQSQDGLSLHREAAAAKNSNTRWALGTVAFSGLCFAATALLGSVAPVAVVAGVAAVGVGTLALGLGRAFKRASQLRDFSGWLRKQADTPATRPVALLPERAASSLGQPVEKVGTPRVDQGVAGTGPQGTPGTSPQGTPGTGPQGSHRTDREGTPRIEQARPRTAEAEPVKVEAEPFSGPRPKKGPDKDVLIDMVYNPATGAYEAGAIYERPRPQAPPEPEIITVIDMDPGSSVPRKITEYVVV